MAFENSLRLQLHQLRPCDAIRLKRVGRLYYTTYPQIWPQLWASRSNLASKENILAKECNLALSDKENYA